MSMFAPGQNFAVHLYEYFAVIILYYKEISFRVQIRDIYAF